MKKFSFLSATVLFLGLAAYAQDGTNSKKWYLAENMPAPGSYQDLKYEVRGRYSRPVKQEALNEAKYLSNFIPGYPVNWIADYVSTEILATCNGKAMKAAGVNNTLSTEQKNMLNTVDIGTEIVVNVKYKYKNPVTDNIEDYQAHITMMVVPETEAEYIGGYQQLINYLKSSVVAKLPESSRKQFQGGIVTFTINEAGEATNTKISRTSGDAKADKVLIDIINQMPKWKPAENSKWIKVKQDFELSIGGGGC